MNYDFWIIKLYHIAHFELIADTSLDNSIDRHESLSDYFLGMSPALD
jgi:hypothetical protein